MADKPRVIKDYGLIGKYSVRHIEYPHDSDMPREGIDIRLYVAYGRFDGYTKHGIFIPLDVFDRFTDLMEKISLEAIQQRFDFAKDKKEGDDDAGKS